MIMTDLGEGMAELGQHIAKLMDALTKARQSNNPLVHQVAPRKGAMEGGHNSNSTQSPKFP